MEHFAYRDGALHAEGLPVARIADVVGTPFYLYSAAALSDAYREFSGALAGLPATICYALKANDNLAVVATFAALGAGADVVSGGELRRALRAGVPPEKIVFAGVGKTAAELAAGLGAGIMQFNVESLPELAALNRVAQAAGRRAPVAIRINPDVDALTHAKITTGKAENKFGVDLAHARAAYAEAARMPGIAITGVALHIGSQLTELEPYRAAFAKLVALAEELRGEGHGISRLDFGGGLGIDYGGIDHGHKPAPRLADYAAVVRQTAAGRGYDLVFEPGRRLVGNAGLLVTRVVFVKEGSTRSFVIVDAAMNDLIRPALYDAYHEIVTVSAPAVGAPQRPVDIVGPICESTDRFAEQRPLPPVEAGDLLAIRSAGAYAAVMASAYNARLPAPEVMVRGEAFEIVRPRPDYEAMMAQERMPAWLQGSEAPEDGLHVQEKAVRGAA